MEDIYPTADRILIKVERKNVSKIWLPDLKKPGFKCHGIVERVGCLSEFKKGDEVYFAEKVGKETGEYLMMRDVDIVKMDKEVKGDNIIVDIIESKEKTKGGLIIPIASQEESQIPTAKVVDIGKLVKGVEKNDIIHFLNHAGTDVVLDDVKYKKLKPDDVVFINGEIQGDRVLVQMIENKEKTIGSIIIPDSAQAKNQTPKAKVITIGEDVTEVKPDDIAYFLTHSGANVTLKETKYKVLRQDDILFKDK